MWKQTLSCCFIYFMVVQQVISTSTSTGTASTTPGSSNSTNRLDYTITQTTAVQSNATATDNATSTVAMVTASALSCGDFTGEIRKCFTDTYGLPRMDFTTLNLDNVLEQCRKRIYLNYCINTKRYSCHKLQPINDSDYLMFDSLCKRITDSVAVIKCQRNYTRLNEGDIYNNCIEALSRTNYNDTTIYKKAANNNTCIFEQLRVKCEALVIRGQCMTYYRNYHFLMDVHHAQNLKNLGCDAYVDIPCRFKLNFANDIC